MVGVVEAKLNTAGPTTIPSKSSNKTLGILKRRRSSAHIGANAEHATMTKRDIPVEFSTA
jgi:hypothetical protein